MVWTPDHQIARSEMGWKWEFGEVKGSLSAWLTHTESLGSIINWFLSARLGARCVKGSCGLHVQFIHGATWKWTGSYCRVGSRASAQRERKVRGFIADFYIFSPTSLSLLSPLCACVLNKNIEMSSIEEDVAESSSYSNLLGLGHFRGVPLCSNQFFW